MDNQGLLRRFYPEANIGGFSHVDGTISFYTQIAAVLKPTDCVLDFGAGRGEPLLDDDNSYRRGLSNLQGRCAHVEGCDIDPAAEVALASLRQAVAMGRIGSRDIVALNITGGGHRRLRRDRRISFLRPHATLKLETLHREGSTAGLALLRPAIIA